MLQAWWTDTWNRRALRIVVVAQIIMFWEALKHLLGFGTFAYLALFEASQVPEEVVSRVSIQAFCWTSGALLLFPVIRALRAQARAPQTA